MWLMFSCRQETLGDPVEGQTGEAAKTLKIARMERQLSVGQLLLVLEEGRAQTLLDGHIRGLRILV